MKKVVHDLLVALGITRHAQAEAASEPADAATRLAERRTDLALERSYLASERTLMAWIRTSLAMISFGFTIGKVGEALGSESVPPFFGRTAGIRSVAYFLVVLGTVALIAAVAQNRAQAVKLFEMGLTPQVSLAFFIALLLGLMGLFAFAALVLNL